MAEQYITLRLSLRELATLRGALKYHADENLQASQGIPDVLIERMASMEGRLKPLDYREAEALLERLNLAETEPDPLRQIQDQLYLVIEGGREIYDPGKDWNVDTLAAIAKVIGRYIPRPSRPD